MNFLTKIKQWFGDKKEPISITDEVFGTLVLNEFKNTNLNYWQGTSFFDPTKTEIDYFIRTKEQKPPNSGQKDFFLSLNQNYPSLSKLWGKAIDREIGDSLFEMKITLENVPLETYFKLAHIEIPERFYNEANWNVTFFAISEIDLKHEFTIKMKGWDALGLYING
jgi:hypothetical protein